MADSSERLNDRSDYQGCFACGARNMQGLGLVFQQEDGAVVTTFVGDERHQGFPGVVHGGIVATLLDETLERLGVLEGRWLMTGRLEVRFRRAALLGVPLRVEAHVVASRGRALVAAGSVRAAGQPGEPGYPDTLIADATGTFLPLPAEIAAQVAGTYPGFLRSFETARTAGDIVEPHSLHRNVSNQQG